jgi:hypothetical protein
MLSRRVASPVCRSIPWQRRCARRRWPRSLLRSWLASFSQGLADHVIARMAHSRQETPIIPIAPFQLRIPALALPKRMRKMGVKSATVQGSQEELGARDEGREGGFASVKYPDIGFGQTIQFVSRRRHFGGRQFYFKCPATGRPCSVLWKPSGAKQFACRQAWGCKVAYRTQFAEPTSRAHLAKFKIQRRLSAEDWADLLPPRPKNAGDHICEVRSQIRFAGSEARRDADAAIFD